MTAALADSTDLAVVTEVVGEVVEATALLTKKEAEALDFEIREASDDVSSAATRLVELMASAAEGRIDLALGYRSVSDYFSEAVHIAPSDTAERKLLAAMMNGKGLSQRAIAKALGVSPGTINADLADVDKGDTISTDGRTFKKKEEEPYVEADDATVHHGQKKALAKAQKAIAGVAEALAEAFGDGSNYDADTNEDEVKEAWKVINASWADVRATFKLLGIIK